VFRPLRGLLGTCLEDAGEVGYRFLQQGCAWGYRLFARYAGFSWGRVRWTPGLRRGFTAFTPGLRLGLACFARYAGLLGAWVGGRRDDSERRLVDDLPDAPPGLPGCRGGARGRVRGG
jgi:hypothetical protein